MYVEVVIASICTFIWWFSEPGVLLNQLSLSVMFVSSVSTILFNGNPLLRYDGYYILSDIMEIPNLRQKSSTILTRKLGNWCLGLEEPDDPFLPQRNHAMFALYSVAAVVYRWLVLIMILLFLYRVFEPIGLQVLGQAIAAASLYGLIVNPLWKLGKFFSVPGRLHQVKKVRMFATLAVVAAVLAAVFLLPLPHSVYCPFEVQLQDAEQVFVEVPGTLLKPARPAGSVVRSGDVLAELSNLDLELEMARVQGELEVLNERISTLQLERLQEDNFATDAANVLRETEKRRDSVREQLAQKQQDLDHLQIVAPVDGHVMPGPLVSGSPPAAGLLPTWSGTPLDKHNVGAYLQASDLLCQIGDPQKMEAVLVIDQSDRNYVKVNDRVEIKLNHLPRQTFETKIEGIANAELEESPRRLSDKAGGDLLTEVDKTGREVPLSTSYMARAPLPSDESLLQIGLRGKAKIHTAPQTVAKRVWRFLSRTFSFEL
jgi:putative peptide zinc metalloprotease protein